MNNIPSKLHVKPFPWKCGECGERQVYLDHFSYSCPIAYDGRTLDLQVAEVQAPRCRKCGEVVLTDDANEQISEALQRTVLSL
jgi:ribosomal protein S27E